MAFCTASCGVALDCARVRNGEEGWEAKDEQEKNESLPAGDIGKESEG